MIVTEGEASTKWCPFVRLSMGQGEQISPAFNRFVFLKDESLENNGNGVRCIGSECMAWRWVPEKGENESPPGGRVGYCRLAGKP